MLNFVGGFNAPSGSGGGNRRRGLLSNVTVPGDDSSPAGTGDANADALNGASAYSPSLADSPPAFSELSAAGSNVVSAAAGLYPAWCANTKWRTELVPRGKRLQPADLLSAMVATGVKRGVKRR